MGLRSSSLALAGLILLSLPVHAQATSSTVSFDGVGFSFDPTLGTSVNITEVPAQRPDRPGIGAPGAAHLAFTLYGPRPESSRIPRPLDAPGVARFYRVPDLAPYDWASAQLEELTSLLADRPALNSRMTVGEDGGVDPLPFILDNSAAQALLARARYVDTPELAGVAYLTAFRQDVSPFAAGDFWYTFQGISSDGAWYVAVDFVIEADDFPAKVSPRQARRLTNARRWTRYVNDSIQTLNAAGPDAFDPPLTSIDALVQSITFGPATP
jgi:hypothetical protein